MAKITLNDITNSENISAINDNFSQISDTLNNGVLYRDNPVGEPNAMQNDLDMNGFKILNVDAFVPSIGDGTLTTAMYQDGSVTTPKIADGNVTNAKLAIDAVAQSNMQDNSVGTNELINLSITSGKIAAQAIGDTQLNWLNVMNRVVPTIATLRTLDKTKYSRVIVVGYYAAQDGGGGQYVLDTTDTTSADNGGSIIVGADGGRWKLALTNTVNIRQWGAKGDAVTNDYNAFNNALQWILNTFGSGKIYMPRGSYILGSRLIGGLPGSKNSITFEGEGEDVTELVWSNTSGGILINYTAPGHSSHFRHFSCITAQANGGIGIACSQTMSLNQFMQSNIDNVTFRGVDNLGGGGSAYWSIGYLYNGVCGTNVKNVTVYGALNFGATSAVGGQYQGNSAAISNPGNGYSIYHNINGCVFNNLSIGTVYGSYCQGMTILQTNVQNTTTGFYCPPGSTGLLAQLQIGSSQYACTGNNIHIASPILNVMIFGNNIIPINGNSGILNTSPHGISVVGNQIISGDASANFGCVIGAPAGGSYHSGTVTGNSFIGLGTGVALQSGSIGNNVQSNSYYNCTTNTSNAGTNTVGGGSA